MTMQRIDAHAHFIGDHPLPIAMLDELNLKVVNIGVAEEPDPNSRPWRASLAHYKSLAQQWPNHFAWITAVELPDFAETDYAGRAIAQLDQDFTDGAVGAKVWKNIGMDIRKPDGSHLLIDDPIFEPVFAHLEHIGKPLLMHIAEPLACWLPPKEGDPHSAYYVRNPQWHMYGRNDVPSHADLMVARDRVVERHPKLRVVGAHLASLEYDLNEVARRLDHYPNFAIDTGGRAMDLAHYTTPDAARHFLNRYQDRVLWGTDVVRTEPFSTYPDGDAITDELGHVRRQYHNEFAFYGSDSRGELFHKTVERLNLPDTVTRKLFHDNARAWYPGV